MTQAVHVVGVGMIPFTKPGASESCEVMGAKAAQLALDDAGIAYTQVDQAYVGYVFGDSTAGQAAVYGVGMTGIPLINVNNNCATGSTALFLTRQAVASGSAGCVLALGFDQMGPGPLKGNWTDRPSPLSRFLDSMATDQGWNPALPRAAQFFGGAARACMADFGMAASTFESHDMRKLVGADMARAAAAQVYAAAGIGPEDLDVVELHDCFTANELITYESLGLTPEGAAERFILDGDNSYGGRVVTHPSGGLLSKGHPLGATGLAQCAELTWQLRGQAEQRQVEGARLALQHNLGLGGACVVTLYEKVDA